MTSLFDDGPFAPCPARFNLARHTLAPAGVDPGKTALELIRDADAAPERWSFADLGAAVGGTMAGLAAAGVGRGDRVLLRLDHSVDFPVLFFAAAGMGAVPVPTSAQLTAPEVAKIRALLAPKLAIAAPGVEPGGGFVPAAEARAWRNLPPRDFADTAADDPAYIIFTSGTGGQPKGVVHAHRAGWARRMMWADWYGLGAGDRLLHAGAFNWTYTLGTGLTDPWAAGATALIYAGPPDRGVWPRIIARHRPTIFAAAPGVYRQLLAAGSGARADYASLRHGLTAGEAMPARLRAAWEAATGTPVLEALGMSEISTYASEAPGRPGLRPQHGRRVAVLAEDGPDPVARGTPGRLAVAARDPGLMLGYWRADGAPELPLTGEWFVTGDRAAMADDGVLAHLGRLDDILNAQGYRVSAREVEDALAAHPGVAECAAVELPVRADVSVLAAFVVPAAPADVTAEALKAHCAGLLAGYKCPREIRLVPALPRTPTGKVMKRRLIEDHGWREAP